MDISIDEQAKSWRWLGTRNLERETEIVVKAAQNNNIRASYIKAKINKSQ